MTAVIGVTPNANASDIPSDGPSTVQEDLDSVLPVTTGAELAARFPPPAQVNNFLIDGGAGAATDGNYTINVNSTPFTVAAVSQTRVQVIAALEALIDAGAEPVTADDSGGTPEDIDVTGDVEGVSFGFSAVAPVGESWTVVTTTSSAIPVSVPCELRPPSFPLGIDLGVGQVALVPPLGNLYALGDRVNMRSGISTGAVVVGHGNVTNVNIIHSDVGPNSCCADVGGPGRPIRWTTVGLTGRNPGRFHDFGGLTLTAVFLVPTIVGALPLTIDGTSGSFNAEVTNAVGTPGTVGYTLVELPGTLSVDNGSLDLGLNSSHADDRAVRIDAGVGLPADSLIGVVGSVTGVASGEVFATPGLDHTSPEIMATGGNGPQSKWIADLKSASFNFTHADSVWEFFPVAGFAMVTPPTQRHFFDVPWVKPTGRSPRYEDVRAVEYKLTAVRAAAGGSRTVSVKIVQREGDGGPITDVPGTETALTIDGTPRSVDITVGLSGTNLTQLAFQTFSADAGANQTQFTTTELLQAWSP